MRVAQLDAAWPRSCVLARRSSEAETFWLDFLRSLTRRGLRGVKLVISDAHVNPLSPGSEAGAVQDGWPGGHLLFGLLHRALDCRVALVP